MDNKGFTLVELVATIALLAVISTISFVSINAVVDKSKISECNGLVNNIKSATKEYVSDNRYNLDEIKDYMVLGDDKKYRFSVAVLTNKNKLTKQVINPFDDNDVTSNTFVEVILNSDYNVKKIIVNNSLGNEINCEDKKW